MSEWRTYAEGYRDIASTPAGNAVQRADRVVRSPDGPKRAHAVMPGEQRTACDREVSGLYPIRQPWVHLNRSYKCDECRSAAG